MSNEIEWFRVHRYTGYQQPESKVGLIIPAFVAVSVLIAILGSIKY